MSVRIPTQADEILAVLRDLREARDIHMEWASWIDANPAAARAPEPVAETAGDPGHHRDWVSKYDRALHLIEHLGRVSLNNRERADRELARMLDLRSAGLTNVQIAQRLGISPKTVEGRIRVARRRGVDIPTRRHATGRRRAA